MVEFSVSEIMYAMYSQLNLDYLYPSLHDNGEFVQLVHCCLPRFQSSSAHRTHSMHLAHMNESINEETCLSFYALQVLYSHTEKLVL